MIVTDLCTVFSTFDMDKLGKIRWHHWKQRFKINKIAWFESDLLKTNEDRRSHGGSYRIYSNKRPTSN